MSSSTSKIVSCTASGHHLLKIEGYSHTQSALPSGQLAMSAPFTVAGHQWIIGYYPNGVTDYFRRYISLYLFRSGCVNSPVTARVQFSLASAADERLGGSKKTKPIKYGGVKRVTTGQWACTKFIKRADLEKSKHLMDDSFTVRCDIVVSNGFRAEAGSAPAVPRAMASVTVPPSDSDLVLFLAGLLETGSGAVATVEVAGQKFVAQLKDVGLDFLKSSGNLSAAMSRK